MADRPATLATVAAAVGVSRTTVSNAFAKPDQLSPALREQVLAAARELGYDGPDPAARSLSLGRTGSVGLVFDHPLGYAFSDPAAVLFLQGVAAGCEERGTGLSLVPRLPELAAQQVRGALVDGFILYCTPEDDERLVAVQRRGLPYVLVDYEPRPDARQVGIDDRGAARAAAQHLVDLGHRRFGIVLPYGRRSESAAAAEAEHPYYVGASRLAGWGDALRAAGIDWAAVPVGSGPGEALDTGHAAAASLLDRAERPTAIIALSDLLATGVLAAAAERGIAVPEDLSVVGFDDVPDAARTSPPLTTVRQPHAGKGSAAVRLLLDGGGRVELPTELVVRASTSPAPRKASS